MLIVFGLVLALADRRTRHACRRDGRAARSAPRDAAIMGLAQAVALQPGVSRSGVTITAGRFLGFDRESAARLSFSHGDAGDRRRRVGQGPRRSSATAASRQASRHRSCGAWWRARVTGALAVWGLLQTREDPHRSRPSSIYRVRSWPRRHRGIYSLASGTAQRERHRPPWRERRRPAVRPAASTASVIGAGGDGQHLGVGRDRERRRGARLVGIEVVAHVEGCQHVDAVAGTRPRADASPFGTATARYPGGTIAARPAVPRPGESLRQHDLPGDERDPRGFADWRRSCVERAIGHDAAGPIAPTRRRRARSRRPRRTVWRTTHTGRIEPQRSRGLRSRG